MKELKEKAMGKIKKIDFNDLLNDKKKNEKNEKTDEEKK